MSWLSDSALEQMRDDVLAMLPDECDILQATITRDDEGEAIVTWTVKSSDVPCRLDYKQGREVIVGAAVQPFAKAMLTLPWYAVIKTNERVQIGTALFAVKTVSASQSWNVSVRAEVEAVL